MRSLECESPGIWEEASSWDEELRAGNRVCPQAGWHRGKRRRGNCMKLRKQKQTVRVGGTEN